MSVRPLSAPEHFYISAETPPATNTPTQDLYFNLCTTYPFKPTDTSDAVTRDDWSTATYRYIHHATHTYILCWFTIQ